MLSESGHAEKGSPQKRRGNDRIFSVVIRHNAMSMISKMSQFHQVKREYFQKGRKPWYLIICKWFGIYRKLSLKIVQLLPTYPSPRLTCGSNIVLSLFHCPPLSSSFPLIIWTPQDLYFSKYFIMHFLRFWILFHKIKEQLSTSKNVTLVQHNHIRILGGQGRQNSFHTVKEFFNMRWKWDETSLYESLRNNMGIKS